MPATGGRPDGRHEAVLPVNSGGNSHNVENDTAGSTNNSRSRSGRGGRGGRGAGPQTKPAPAVKAQMSGGPA